MKAKLYNQEGKDIGETDLPDKVFALPWNPDLVHQVVVAHQANQRQSIAHTKTRAEVRGGGRKPWRQKGTGRARHGSRRSPIWVGGGVAHGPRAEKDYSKKINKKMNRKAILTVLSRKAHDNELVVLDSLKLEQAKTKPMNQVLKNLPLKKISAVIGLPGSRSSAGPEGQKAKAAELSLPGSSKLDIVRASRNIPKVKAMPASQFNVLELLNHKYVILPQESIGVIEKTFVK